MSFTGTSDDVIALPAHVGVALRVTANYSGDSNFVIQSPGDLLVNDIGAYSGVVPLDLTADSQSLSLQVTADGPWSITVDELYTNAVRVVQGVQAAAPGDLVYIYDGSGTVASAQCQCDGNFVVLAYSLSTGSGDLLINHIGGYAGKVPIDGASIVVVTADGPWTIDVT